MSDPDLLFNRTTAQTEAEGWALVQAQIAAAEARGYDRAVARLRDDDRWRAWRRTRPRDEAGWSPGALTEDERKSAADYLDAMKEATG
jgi:hypothetical protein